MEQQIANIFSLSTACIDAIFSLADLFQFEVQVAQSVAQLAAQLLAQLLAQ